MTSTRRQKDDNEFQPPFGEPGCPGRWSHHRSVAPGRGRTLFDAYPGGGTPPAPLVLVDGNLDGVIQFTGPFGDLSSLQLTVSSTAPGNPSDAFLNDNQITVS